MEFRLPVSVEVNMSFLVFFRSEPVRVGIRAGFLGEVIYLALRHLGGCP